LKKLRTKGLTLQRPWRDGSGRGPCCDHLRGCTWRTQNPALKLRVHINVIALLNEKQPLLSPTKLAAL